MGCSSGSVKSHVKPYINEDAPRVPWHSLYSKFVYISRRHVHKKYQYIMVEWMHKPVAYHLQVLHREHNCRDHNFT